MGQRVGIGPTRVGHPADGDGRGDGPTVLPEVQMERDRTDRGGPLGCWTLAMSSAGPFGGGWNGPRRAPGVGGRVERAAAAGGHICLQVFPGTVGDGGGRMPGLPDAVRHRRVAVRPPTTSLPSVFQRSTPEAPGVRAGRDGPLGRPGSALGGPTPAESNLAALGAGTLRARQTSMAEHGWHSLECVVTETRSPEGRTHNGTSGAGEQSTEAWIEPGGRDPCQLCTGTPATR